jgi:hypothetical protein
VAAAARSRAVHDQADRMRRVPLEFGHGLLKRRRSRFLRTGHDESRVLRSEIGSSPAPEADQRRADVVGRWAPGKLECRVTRAQRILDLRCGGYRRRSAWTSSKASSIGGADAVSRAGKAASLTPSTMADRGDLVDGVAAFAKLRGRVRDAG